jgi:hypothetical protein
MINLLEELFVGYVASACWKTLFVGFGKETAKALGRFVCWEKP